MKIIFKIWLVLIFFLEIITFRFSPAQTVLNIESDSTKYFLHIGEELTYIVKYAFLNLGEVKFHIKGNRIIDGKYVTETNSYMDSYEGLPFVDLHQKYSSFCDSNYSPVKFIGVMFEEDTNFVQYSFNGDSVIKITKGDYTTRSINFDSTVYVNKKYQDGLSILFYSRKFVGTDSTHIIPCFVNEKEETTVLTFYSESEPVEIENVDYEIDCLKIDGETDFVSVYGLTGEFEGWFSNDVHKVPIKAKMNVIIGSVTLELIQWKTKNWNPPKYLN
ncbi:MAG: DUF3108 domain-containing protein [Ignavibacteriaceae bacterium]|nr:DUF3108 domain-containing protein [Ignavibacteriaceae bacterium]